MSPAGRTLPGPGARIGGHTQVRDTSGVIARYMVIVRVSLMDDIRLGRLVRVLRLRAGLTQAVLASRAHVSQTTVSRLERGHLGRLSLVAIRGVLAALDIRLDLAPRWRGGEADRLIDADHAQLVGAGADLVSGYGWEVVPELTYSVFGERGSIDLVALDRASRTAVMFEMKTMIASVEEVLRTTDAKLRLLPGLIQERYGWRPTTTVRVLVLGATRTNRRRVERHETVLSAVFPGSTVATKRWLRARGSLAPKVCPPGIWFIEAGRPRTSGRRATTSGRPAPGMHTRGVGS